MKTMLFQKMKDRIPFTIEWDTLKSIYLRIRTQNSRKIHEFSGLTKFILNLSNFQGFLIGIFLGLILFAIKYLT